MGTLFALASAACYGVVDFGGGLMSCRVLTDAGGSARAGVGPVAAVTFLGQLSSLLLATAAALLVPAASPHPADLCWGALSGAGSAAAMLCLNRGLSRGATSVVVPVSAVTSMARAVRCRRSW